MMNEVIGRLFCRADGGEHLCWLALFTAKEKNKQLRSQQGASLEITVEDVKDAEIILYTLNSTYGLQCWYHTRYSTYGLQCWHNTYYFIRGYIFTFYIFESLGSKPCKLPTQAVYRHHGDICVFHIYYAQQNMVLLI